MSSFAIIPARGGSKRIPNKNIKKFCGKPIIAYSIETAIKSKIFKQVIVSTDSNKIAELSIKYGAVVNNLRPKELSNDFSTTAEVMNYEVKKIQEADNQLSAVCCIYATAPFLKSQDLIDAYNIFQINNWDCVFSAQLFSYPIQRSFFKLENGGIKMFQPKYLNTRSQDLTKAYHDAGQFYWAKPSAWLKGKNLFSVSSIYELPVWAAYDIDSLEDWEMAERMYKINNNINNDCNFK